MPLDAWIGLLAANFIASLVPGQNVALVAGAALKSGLAFGGAALGGILFADVGWTLLALLLIEGLLELDPGSIAAMQILGGGVLVVLGFSLLTQPADAEVPAVVPVRRRRRGTFALGALVGFANPMALIFFLAILPQFLQAEKGAPTQTLLCLVAILLSSTVALAPYLLASARLAPSGLAWLLRPICGLSLIGFGSFALVGLT